MARDELAQARKPIRRRDLVLATLLLVFWLIPIAYQAVAAVGPRWFGRSAQEVYQISALFTDRHEGLSQFYIRYRREGTREWVDLNEIEYFQHRPFGFRNRFDRFMMRYAFKKDHKRHLQRRAFLADWIIERDRLLHPGEPVIVQVRFYFVTHKLGETPPTGHWVKKPLKSFHPRERHAMEIYTP